MLPHLTIEAHLLTWCTCKTGSREDVATAFWLMFRRHKYKIEPMTTGVWRAFHRGHAFAMRYSSEISMVNMAEQFDAELMAAQARAAIDDIAELQV